MDASLAEDLSAEVGQGSGVDLRPAVQWGLSSALFRNALLGFRPGEVRARHLASTYLRNHQRHAQVAVPCATAKLGGQTVELRHRLS
jgi:hypothetical protein